MRFCLFLAVTFSAPVVSSAQTPDETLVFYLSKSDVVVAAEIVNDPGGYSHNANVFNYPCALKVFEVIKGDPKMEKRQAATIMRVTGTGGIPQKGSRYILFLNRSGSRGKSLKSADYWFGVQTYFATMSKSLQETQAQLE